MKCFPIILIILFLVSANAFSQGAYQDLRKKLLQADSVVIVNHSITAGIKIVDDSSGKEIPLPELIINGKLNEKIIHERKLISGIYLESLANILDPLTRDITIIQGQCFMPHHAIFIFNKSRVSYLEICFACRNFETSKDLNKLYGFSENTWDQLEQFFESLGFKYKLQEDNDK